MSEEQAAKHHKALSTEQVNAIADVKATEKTLLTIIDVAGADKRWAAIAKTDIEKGVMAAVRSIANSTE